MIAIENAVRGSRRYYRADLVVDGRRVGYVERLTAKTLQFHATDYRAHVGGLTVAAERTLTNLREALREWWEAEGRFESDLTEEGQER